VPVDTNHLRRILRRIPEAHKGRIARWWHEAVECSSASTTREVIEAVAYKAWSVGLAQNAPAELRYAAHLLRQAIHKHRAEADDMARWAFWWHSLTHDERQQWKRTEQRQQFAQEGQAANA
jgi:hypothetical protein